MGMRPLDTAGPSAGLDTMAEDLDQLKYDVGELKDLLSNNKGEVNHIRRIVLACERDMEDFTAAMDAVNVDLDEMRARVDATRHWRHPGGIEEPRFLDGRRFKYVTADAGGG